MARTLIQNISGSALTLPSPYGQTLKAGAHAVAAESKSSVVDILGGPDGMLGLWRVSTVPEGNQVTLQPGGSAVPFTADKVVTINVRPGGSDSMGSIGGGIAFRTLDKGARSVPSLLPHGYRFVVDLTGINDVLPDSYELPVYKAPRNVFNQTSVSFNVASVVDFQAIPQRTALISAADSTIAASDITSQTQDAVTQLITLTISVARASWGSNALKGKFVVGNTGGTENAVIVASTTTTLVLAATSALSTPITIMDAGATLTGSGAQNTAGQNGALNCRGSDTVGFSGLKVVTTTSGGFGLAIDSCGHANVQMCELQNPAVLVQSNFFSRVIRNWIYGTINRFQGSVSFLQGLFDATSVIQLEGRIPLSASFRRMAVIGCGPIDVTAQPPGVTAFPGMAALLSIENTLVSGTPGASGDGVRFHGGRMRMSRVDVYGCGRDGVRMESGSGWAELLNVRTTGAVNTGVGLRVLDGAQVKVDSATSGASGGTELRGTDGQMQVGSGAARDWADFVDGSDGRPTLNEYDITAAAATGATGTGSRVYQ